MGWTRGPGRRIRGRGATNEVKGDDDVTSSRIASPTRPTGDAGRPRAVRAAADRRRDLRLARAVAGGDEAAAGELLALYRAPLRAFIGHRLALAVAGGGGAGRTGSGPAGALDDVEQETLLAAMRAIGGYRGQAALFTWLCAIARRKVADCLRRFGREPLPLSALPEAGWYVELSSDDPLPDDIVADRAVRALVVEALWSLPGHFRDALLLRYADGQPVAEVARRLSRTYKGTESLLMRAKAALRQRLLGIEGLEEEMR